jgi:hypothetical protein
MGIDFHGLNFLFYSQKKFNDFGRVITLGRQRLHLDIKVKKKLGIQDFNYLDQVSNLLFGTKVIDSMDYSDYQGANIIHDLNLPIGENLTEKYDTLIDLGTLEHVFNVVQALDNCDRLIKVGGKIIHVLPANNFNGHGFYQFSPELFFTYYSIQNGYQTEIFLAKLDNTRYWFKLSKPSNGNRLEVNKTGPMYVMVVAKKKSNVELKKKQQSDYEFIWKGNKVKLPKQNIYIFIFKIYLKRLLVWFKLFNFALFIKTRLKTNKDDKYEKYFFRKLSR